MSLKYHVYGPHDTEPTIVHEGLIDEYLSSHFTANDIVQVDSIREIHEMTIVYNGPKGLPLPPKPSNPPPSAAVQITHIKKG